MTSSDEVHAYWEQRAEESEGAARATTDDVWLRELEVGLLSAAVGAEDLAGARVVDLGCGDGRTILRLATEHPEVSFLGLDYSEGMLTTARALLEQADPSVRARVQFARGDLLDLEEALGDETFPLVMTDRVLINLTSEPAQFQAVRAIAAHVAPGGRYLAIENFLDGQAAMNAARADVGLPEIPVRWHNLYFDEDRFLELCRSLFDEVSVDDFSSTYYLVTRVAYSAWCQAQGVPPDYHHPMHEIATKLPRAGRFSPIRLVTMRRAAEG